MFDVVIVGGGIIGCSFALELAHKNPNLKIIIIDKQIPDFSSLAKEYDSRIYAITPNNYAHLASLDLPIDESRTMPISRMSIRGNNSLLEFDAIELRYEYLAKIIESQNLHYALYQKLELLDNVQFKYINITDINEYPVYVELIDDNQNKFSGKLLVAADGPNSFIRQKFNFAVEKIPYSQAGVVANFKCIDDHKGVAYQWFLKDSVLAYLPLPNQQISIVWSSIYAQELLTLNALEFSAKVAEASGNLLGKLELINQPKSFPLELNLVREFYRGRVILIGDAMHTIHPLAGQGLNLGLGDAWELAGIIANTDLSKFNQFTLARFNASRLSKIRTMQITCHMLYQLFDNRLLAINKLRNFGMNLVNNIMLLKKLLTKIATNY